MKRIPLASPLILALAAFGTPLGLGCNASMGGGRGAGGDSGGGDGNPGSGAGSGAGAATGEGGTGTLPGPNEIDSLCAEAKSDTSVGTAELRRLSRSQYRNVITDLLGLSANGVAYFLPDGKTGPFDTNATFAATELDIDKYQAEARDLAGRVTLAKVLPCDPALGGATGQDKCANQFIDEFGLRAYRRPLTTAERTALRALYDAAKADGFETGARLVIEGALQSPGFLYLPEVGTGGDPRAPSALDDFELATRLSFLLWNSIPDAPLFAAAKAGELRTEEQLVAQTERMLADARFGRTARSFVKQWLTIDRIHEVSRDMDRFPFFTRELADQMVAETERFAEQVLTKSDGKLSSLLLADYTMLITEAPLPTQLYEIAAVRIAADGRAPFNNPERAGVLSHLSVLTKSAPIERSAPIHRGILVRENFLCQHLPSPPDDVRFVVPPNADQLTPQELLRTHQEDPTCAPCHALVDPIGFTFTHFDAVGRFKPKLGMNELDNSGELVGSDVDGAVVGVRQLSEKLAQSEMVKSCLAQQWFRYAVGRDPTELDACSLSAIKRAGVESDGDLRRMVVALAQTTGFRFVQADD